MAEADPARALTPRAPIASTRLAVAVAVAVALLSAAPRVAVAAGAIPDAARPFLWADMLATFDYLGGRAPYWEVPFYYPPLVGYASGALAKIVPTAAAFVAVWAVLVAAAAGAVATLLARARGARAALVYWAATPQLLLFAGVNFDAIAVLAAVASVLLAPRRPILALATLAIGTCVKAFPAAIVPLELDRVRRNVPRLIASVAVFIGLILVVSLPSLLAPWPVTYSVPDYARKVTSESVWGLVQGVLAAFSLGHLVVPLTLAGLAATFLLGVMPAARRAADPSVGAGLAVLTLLIWSRIYQPQYSLWILPFLALAGIQYRWLAILSIADIGVFATLMLIEGAGAAPPAEALLALLTAGVTLRHVALVGIWLALYRIGGSVQRVPAEHA